MEREAGETRVEATESRTPAAPASATAAPLDAQLRGIHGAIGSRPFGPQFRDIQATIGNRSFGRTLSRKLSDPLIQLSWKAGYKSLSKEEQDRIIALVDSGLSFSTGQKEALTKYLLDPKSDLSAAGIRAWLSSRDVKANMAPIARAGGIPTTSTYKSAKLEGPTDAGDITMSTGTWKCDKYVMVLDGIRIPIYRPKDPPDPSKGTWPENTHILEWFKKTPLVVASKIVAVHLQREWYNMTDKGSWGSAGGNGVFNIHPQLNTTAADWANTNIGVVHETGHVVSFQKWGATTDTRWDAWRKAMKADGIRVSKYAYASDAEDFAESFAMWATVVGTSNESAVRNLIPNRIKILDPMLADAETSAKVIQASAP